MTDLAQGHLELRGPIPWASNYTFLGRLVTGDRTVAVVYKPTSGAAPLWDFDRATLAGREVAAYLVSEAAGWGLVPQTVLRDGPHGPGAVQVYVEHDPTVTAFDLGQEHVESLRSLAVFDLVVNNADRKAGHVLLGFDGKLWAIDHGICFHEEPKLRTVLWGFIGDPISPKDIEHLRTLLEALDGELHKDLRKFLSSDEIAALKERTFSVMGSGVYPEPGPGRPVPWPQV